MAELAHSALDFPSSLFQRWSYTIILSGPVDDWGVAGT